MLRILIVFVFSALSVSAQYVTLPDSNFRKIIKERHPACITADNKLDVACAASLKGYLDVGGTKRITSIEGIQYFTSIKEFYCSDTKLEKLPEDIPNQIRHLSFGYGQLTRLPEHLPDSLRELHADNNKLSSLPDHLPQKLNYLYIPGNALTVLPFTMPDSLKTLIVRDNKLLVLRPLPAGLEYLECENNQLFDLGTLPNTLKFLNCSENQLIQLPSVMPDSLNKIFFFMNKVKSLPALPATLKNITGFYNCLSTAPTAPDASYSWVFFPNDPSCDPLGLENEKMEEVSLLPNPAQEKVTIQARQATVVWLYNSQGQLLKEQSVAANRATDICLEGLPRGLYFLHSSISNQVRKIDVY